MDDSQRREFHEALLEADTFEDLPGNGKQRCWPLNRTRRRSGSSAATKYRPGVGSRTVGFRA
jgi:hypothetical protein